jgi:dihydroorotase-like cyclic amidohydrolase
VGDTGLPCSIHAHETDIYKGLIRDLKESREMNWKSFLQVSYGDLVRVGTVPTLIYLAEKANLQLYLLHCGWRDFINIVRDAKSLGKDIIADCMYTHLVPAPREGKKTDIRRDQYVAKEENIRATWNALSDGTIDFIDSDHAPHTEEEIQIGLEDPEKMALGYPGIEYYFSLLFNEVSRGRISVERLVQLCSTNAAKIFGIYPRKGSLLVGSDADVTIVDPKRKRIVSSDKLYTKVGWTPYEGYEVTGVPSHTIVRGTVVMEDGDVVGKPGYGEFIKPVK